MFTPESQSEHLKQLLSIYRRFIAGDAVLQHTEQTLRGICVMWWHANTGKLTTKRTDLCDISCIRFIAQFANL